MSKKIKTGLGKGLGALISDFDTNFTKKNIKEEINPKENLGNQSEIDVHEIIQNPYQPRKTFDPVALEELMNSISEHGVIQAITVRKVARGFELISGERRLRASKNLGLKTIPAYVIEVQTDEQMLTIALIENLQRDDLNAIETAHGFKRLIDECGLTQEQVAIKVGKSRSAVTNFLRLIRLPEIVQDGLRDNKISMGHARALLSLELPEKIERAYKILRQKEMSVREAEKFVKNFDKINENILENIPKDKKEKSAELISIEDKLRHHFGTETKINTKNEKSGTIILEFYSVEDFGRITDQLLGQ
jgi:ParB family transcriptional regulator, chromosome partitioning protein